MAHAVVGRGEWLQGAVKAPCRHCCRLAPTLNHVGALVLLVILMSAPARAATPQRSTTDYRRRSVATTCHNPRDKPMELTPGGAFAATATARDLCAGVHHFVTHSRLWGQTILTGPDHTCLQGSLSPACLVLCGCRQGSWRSPGCRVKCTC